MTRSTGPVEATFYLQVEPEWGRPYPADDEPALRKIKASRMSVNRPRDPLPGAVLVKLTVRLPAAAFYPLRPVAVVVVPESMTEPHPVEVLAHDAHDPGDDGVV